MYPGSIFNWHDESFFDTAQATLDTDTSPLFMVVGSADKGPEEFQTVDVNTFNSIYGPASFERHGQNSIQTQNILNAGGKLFFKRVVASDAKLANLIVLANVKTVQKQIQKTDGDGNLIYYTDETQTAETTEVTDWPVMLNVYLDADGNETTEVTDTPVLAAEISWSAKSIENVALAADAGFDFVKAEALKLLDIQEVAPGNTSVFPLFVFTDNGRGVSGKAIRFTPDYNTSKGNGTMFYDFDIVEDSSSVEKLAVTADPTVIFNNTAYRMDKNTSVQVVCETIESVFEDYVDQLADITMIDAETIRQYDLIFGATNSGAIVDTISIAEDSLDLNATVGVPLANGNNGVFGDAPCADKESAAYEAWANAIADVYYGNVTDEVYDVDQHFVAAILDAGFPNNVKAAMADLATFRKDCVFFRDIGTGHYTFSDIAASVSELPPIPYDKTAADCDKFIADFVTSYNVVDPQTQKIIEVTMLYDFATCLVDHLKYRPNAPTAGTYNNFVLKNAIKGTVNFTPINTRKVNQKQAMEDLHVNYAIFEYDNCVVQTVYTAQHRMSQLSYINNVLAIQWVIRAVRAACPKNRYSLANGVDLSNYKKAVDNVLGEYRDSFDILEFEYQTDTRKVQQRIFYATIRFAFLNWAQTEVFDIYAINNN